MLARKMKSCLDVTIVLVVGITTIAGDLINIQDKKSKYFDMKLGGGGFDCDDVIIEIYL